MGAGAQVIGAGWTPTVRGFVGTSVWVKRSWGDEWTWLPYVQAIEAEEVAPPNVCSAQFSHWYGLIKRHDAGFWDLYSPVSLMGCYVQIVAHPIERGCWPWAAWVGKIEDEQGRVHNVPEAMMSTNALTGVASLVSGWAQGEQRFTALGLEHWLDRVPILGSYTGAEGGWIQRDMVFNRKDKVGVNLTGNRSTSLLGGNGAYCFSSGTALWTNYDILVYLIVNYLNLGYPGEPVWYIAGCEGALMSIVDRWSLNGMSVFEAFNKLIDRKRGFGWRLITWPDAGAPVIIYVYSLLDVATPWMPANPDQAIIDMDGVNDATAVVTFDNRPRYHEIVVRGGPVSVCGTWAVADGTLEPHWSEMLEAGYTAESDENRATAFYADVYSRFRVPVAWFATGQLGNGEGTPAGPALPTIWGDCSIDWYSVAPLFQPGRRFSPIIPYYDSELGEEFRHMAVFMKVGIDPDTAWWHIEKIGTGADQEGTPAHVRPNDTELGIVVKSRVNHILAGLEWAGETDVEPEYDWHDLIVTAMLETDQEIHVTLPLPAPGLGELKRTKVLEMPDALLWMILPGTVYDVYDGALLREEGLVIFRDDRTMLYAVADFAQLWFGRPRAAVGLEIQRVLPVHAVGTMIGGIVGHTNCLVGTAVTRRRWDFVHCRMSVQTNYEEIDATLSGQIRPPQAPAGRGRYDYSPMNQAGTQTGGLVDWSGMVDWNQGGAQWGGMVDWNQGGLKWGGAKF